MALAPLNPETRNLIAGRLVGASSGATFENVNPATEEVIGTCADGTREDMHAAIAAARRAFDETDWSTDAAFRKKCLLQLCEALQGAKEDLRSIVVAEAGSPVLLTYAVQANAYIDAMPYWAELAGSYTYEQPMSDISFMGQPQRRILRREATGVVGAITPWNFPLYLNLCKLGPALASGNTVVLKPAPDTPWSATTLGRLIAERTDIPAGVVNVVASSDHGVGELLATDPRVDLVTFTGSTATGRRVMECASQTVKKVFLELGGKSAMILLDDVELGKSLAGIGMLCTHAGQGCAITTRVLLPRAHYEEGVGPRQGELREARLRRPHEPGAPDGPGRQPKAARPRARLHREGPPGGRARRHRRRRAEAPREGLLRRADALRRRRPRLDHRPGGDLRAGAGADPLRGRRRRGAHRQPARSTASRARSAPPAKSAPSRWRAASAPGR